MLLLIHVSLKKIIMCDTYVPLVLLRAYRASELLVNTLKYNIKMDIKEIALMITRNKSNFKNTYLQYRHFQSRCLVETMNILTI